MKNEKFANDASKETAVERWENEGGEVLNVFAVEATVRPTLTGKTFAPTSDGLKRAAIGEIKCST